VIILCFGCYTKIKLPEENDPPNFSKKQRVSKFVTLNNEVFNKEVIHLKDRYSLGKGIFYEFNFNNNKEWLGIEDEIVRFLIYDYKVINFYYRSGSSSCIDPLTKTAFFMIIRPRFIVKFSEQPEDIGKYNYTPLRRHHISCGLQLIHYSKIDSLK